MRAPLFFTVEETVNAQNSSTHRKCAPRWGAHAPRVSCSAPSPNALSSVPLETFFQKSEMKLQTSAATIHNPRITIHATTCASLTTFNILFKNKDDQFRSSAVGGPNA